MKHNRRLADTMFTTPVIAIGVTMMVWCAVAVTGLFGAVEPGTWVAFTTGAVLVAGALVAEKHMARSEARRIVRDVVNNDNFSYDTKGKHELSVLDATLEYVCYRLAYDMWDAKTTASGDIDYINEIKNTMMMRCKIAEAMKQRVA